MKNLFKFRILAAFLVMATLAFTSCKKDDPAPIPQPGATQIVGTAKLPVGVAGDLSNAKVSVYLTVDDWNFNNPVKFVGAQGSGATVTFTMPVIAGNYYLDVWRDVDASGTWSIGDFIGWYGGGGWGSVALSPLQVANEQTVTVTIDMIVL